MSDATQQPVQSLQPLPEHAEKVFQGKIFSVYQWEQQLYDGTTTIFEKVARADAASVIAVTPEGKIVLTEQEQPSLKPFWGTVGGVVDPGETHLEAATRELREEAGMEAEQIEHWFSIQPVTKIEWTCAYFVARNCRVVAAQRLDAGEKITLHEVSFDEFIEIACREDFRDKELTTMVLRARLDEQLMAELKHQILG